MDDHFDRMRLLIQVLVFISVLTSSELFVRISTNDLILTIFLITKNVVVVVVNTVVKGVGSGTV